MTHEKPYSNQHHCIKTLVYIGTTILCTANSACCTGRQAHCTNNAITDRPWGTSSALTPGRQAHRRMHRLRKAGIHAHGAAQQKLVNAGQRAPDKKKRHRVRHWQREPCADAGGKPNANGNQCKGKDVHHMEDNMLPYTSTNNLAHEDDRACVPPRLTGAIFPVKSSAFLARQIHRKMQGFCYVCPKTRAPVNVEKAVFEPFKISLKNYENRTKDRMFSKSVKKP